MKRLFSYKNANNKHHSLLQNRVLKIKSMKLWLSSFSKMWFYEETVDSSPF